MRRLIPFVIVLLASIAAPAAAQVEKEPDAEGCKDSPLLTRFPGCRLTECESKEFDAAKVWTGKWKDDDTHQTTLEGVVEFASYGCGPKVSAVQVSRNVEAALKKAGFTIVYSGDGESNNPVVTARKGAQWIEVQTNEGGGETDYATKSVLVKEMKQEVEADASAMAAEIEKTGSVAVYGINFETGKATLTPGSEKVLQEVLSLMKQQPDWRFEVQGHTDNVGSKAANQTLSDERARAVAAWLVRKGIDNARLTSKGYGDTQPVAPNTTEDGRAKNRRVELKKMS